MGMPLRVLVVEDSPDDAELLLYLLRRSGYELVSRRVDTPQAMAAALAAEAWDVVISDYSMPSFDGLAALKLLKHTGLDLPFILVSGTVGEEIAVSAMKAGAHDYVMKANLARLVPAVERELREAEVRRERRQAEEEIRRLNEDLEHRVVERTVQLEAANRELQSEIAERTRAEAERERLLEQLTEINQQLLLANVREHDLAEQREDLIRALSHDLRSPLTAVQGQAQLLLRILSKAQPEARVQRGLEAIVTAARRMNSMIEDLVDSARLESGQLRLNRQPVDLVAFLAELLDRSVGALEAGRVKALMPEDLPWVEADPTRLERILTNLLSNALKYSPPGAEVLVRAQATDGRVVVSVADRGAGIDPQDLPRIFDRFYRAKAARGAEGVGLGLYITRMLVEAHGGRIEVESRPGEGSTFSFSLSAAGAQGPGAWPERQLLIPDPHL